MSAEPSVRLLLVDDDEVDRGMVRRLLAQAQLAVALTECVRAREAAEAVEREPFDCVLLDFQLPDGDGLQVLRFLRERTSLPVVILTGYGDEQVAVELMKAGAADYISKDALTGPRLVASLRQAMRAARAEAEARALQDERRELLRRESEARRQAEAANEAKDQFLAMLSHELRTPLNAILGWTRLLRNNPQDVSLAARGLLAIERSARSQAQLIADLLDVSTIVSGKLRLDFKHTDPGRVFLDALEAVRLQADDKGVVLREEVPPDLRPIVADPDRLQQVIWNLLNNALKFTPAGRCVTARLDQSEEGLTITVSDEGCGIEPAFLPRIFDRFTQAESSRGLGGLGLGLAIVRHFVEQHGGWIEASSDGLGQGATFRAFVPSAGPLEAASRTA